MKTTYERISKDRRVDVACEDCDWASGGDNLDKVWRSAEEHCSLEHHKAVLASKRTKTYLIKEAEPYVPGSRTRRRQAIMYARTGISPEEAAEKMRAEWQAMYDEEQRQIAEQSTVERADEED